jgi:hypothetical protein
MAVPCSITSRETPICSVHSNVLIQKQIPIDSLHPHLGTILCFVCPVSKAIVTEPKDSNLDATAPVHKLRV